VRSRRINRRAAGAVLAVTALVSAACSEDEPEGASADEVSASDGADAREAATEFGLDYTGGTAGEPEGEAYRIGFAHSSDFFPEGDVAADAAVEFINTELGGVGGRPLELVKCNVAAPEDGARCGAEFANDDSIDLVIGGLVLAGNADLYGALSGEAAAIIAAPLDASDYVSQQGVSYNAGALGAGLGGAVYLTEELQPETAALVVTDDVAGRGAAAILTGVVEQSGIELSQVFVPPTATAPEVASALQATGAESADVVLIGLFEPGCIAAYDALRSLNLEPEVVTTSVCWGNAMQEHLAELGEEHTVPNWNFSWFGFNPYVEDLEPSIAAYLAKIEEYGGGDVRYSVAAPIVFDAVMSATQVINEVGVDQASYETLDAGVRAFTGPSMIQAGPQECGVGPYPAICASQVGVYRHTDGEWEPVRSGSDGTAIDLTPYTRPEG
jgi:branched-chain amino acid transport system substrate-binding protein